jgi:hypothetical protein
MKYYPDTPEMTPALKQEGRLCGVAYTKPFTK